MRRILVVTGTLLALLLIPGVAQAHPLGNFTINTYDGLRATTSALEIDHVIDMAEIPTFQQRTEIDTSRDGTISAMEASTYAASTCETVARALKTTVDSAALALTLKNSDISFPPGAGGLPTMRVTCSVEGSLSSGPHRISFSDPTFADHIGWHEITAIGDRTTLAGATVPISSISARLTRYPQDLLRSPLDVRHADFSFRPGGLPAVSDGSKAPRSQTRGVDALTRAFTNLVASHRTSIPFAILALLIAVVLGGMHALAPGHGKTVMAAYVVGRRGSFRQSTLIAATVTATHTAGVVLIGIVLTVSRALAPERVYPWLGFASGLLLILIGVTMVRARLRAHAHSHDHGHQPTPLGTRGLLAMGFVGGMVPSPSALIVLLGAIALGRLWFGILLIAAYGAGMGATLAGAGLLLVKVRARLERDPSKRWAGRTAALVPILAACVVLVLGIATAARGLATI